jgi:hypothetical protein
VFCREHANLTTEDAALATPDRCFRSFPEQVLTVQPKQGRLFTECPVWDVGSDPAMSAPTMGDVPVLILEGALDAATAPEWVDIIRPGLTRSQYVEFPFTGQSVLDEHTWAMTIMNAFLADPTRPVDPAPAARTTLTFVTGRRSAGSSPGRPSADRRRLARSRSRG